MLSPRCSSGSTLPILAGLLSRGPASIGRKTGLLYSLNTLGACAGAAAAGFFLIRLLGVYPTYYGAVTLNLCVAAAAFLLSRTVRESSLEPSAASPKQGDGQDRRASPSRALVSYWLFVIGFAALGYEILWVRTIVHLLNADTYSFASVLCTYLVGYAAGVFVGGRLAGRPARAVPLFCLFAQLIGMAGLLYFPLITHLLDIEVLWRFPLVQSLTISVPYFGHLYVCALLFLVPSFCMGVCFPLLVQIERAWFGKTGRTVSHAFTINTIGCVAGALLTAFFLIPAFGSQRAMLALGVAALVSGGLGAFVVRGRTAKVLYIVILAGGLATAFFEPADSFAKLVNITQAEQTKKHLVRIEDIVEGMTTTASVHYYYATDSRVISTAGINVAGDAVDLRQTQKIQGHLPVILHGGAQSVLTVGFGSGELTKTLTLHNIPDITCVEISPEMVALAKKYFSHINLGSDLERRVTMRYMDAKNYIHLTRRKFDVIENDSIWPGTFAESSSLYTEEYFASAREHLNDGGIFSTWLPLQLPPSTFASIIKTFTGVFENTLLIYPHFVPNRHLLLVGQKSAHPYRFLDAKREFDKVREDLALIGPRDVCDVLEYALADQSSLGDAVKSARVNSDYFPFVEFDMNRWNIVGDAGIPWKNLAAVLRNTRRVDYTKLLSFDGIGEQERHLVMDRLRQRQSSNEYLLGSHIAQEPAERLRILDEGLRRYPDDEDLLRMRTTFSPQ